MRERALVHVGGPSGSDKTALVEAILAAADGPVLAARCVRDDGLRRPRESSPRTHVELRRYLQAGAYAAAVYAFPGQVADPISFYETDLMLNYSKAVILEGDDPLGFVDLEVFVAPVPNARETLFVRRQEDVAAAQRARMDAWERTLSQPDGMAAWMEEVMGVSVWIGIQTRTARSCRQFTCATPADDKTQAASGIGRSRSLSKGAVKKALNKSHDARVSRETDRDSTGRPYQHTATHTGLADAEPQNGDRAGCRMRLNRSYEPPMFDELGIGTRRLSRRMSALASPSRTRRTASVGWRA